MMGLKPVGMTKIGAYVGHSQCPECREECEFTHLGTTDELFRAITPDGHTYHQCRYHHGWLTSDLTGKIVSGFTVTNLNTGQKTIYKSEEEYKLLKALEKPTRRINLDDESIN